MKMIVLIALLAAAGCSDKSSPRLDCGAAIAQGTERLLAAVKSRATSPQMQDSLTELVGKMRTTLTRRCTDDRWSSGAVECFTRLTSQAQMQTCEEKLSSEQLTRLRAELRQIMGTMQTTVGGPGHPPTLRSAAPGSDAEPASADEPAAGGW